MNLLRTIFLLAVVAFLLLVVAAHPLPNEVTLSVQVDRGSLAAAKEKCTAWKKNAGGYIVGRIAVYDGYGEYNVLTCRTVLEGK